MGRPVLAVRFRRAKKSPVEPVLVLNHRHDEAFVEFAHRLVAEGATTPRHLQARLRERYRNAVVRPRELSSESGVIWYVYRDGSWTP